MSIINQINNVIKSQGLNFIKNYTIQHFTICGTYNFGLLYNKKFLLWIKKYDRNFKLHIVKNVITGEYRLRNDIDIMIKIDNFTLARIFVERDNINDDDLVKIIFIGKNAFNELYTVDKIYTSDIKNVAIFHYTTKLSNGDITFVMNDIDNRKENTVFLDNILPKRIL